MTDTYCNGNKVSSCQINYHLLNFTDFHEEEVQYRLIDKQLKLIDPNRLLSVCSFHIV